MWFFRKKRKKLSLSYENDQFDELRDVILSMDGAVLVSEDMHIVGSVDIGTFEYSVGDQRLSMLVENFSGIEITGDSDLVKLVAEKMKRITGSSL